MNLLIGYERLDSRPPGGGRESESALTPCGNPAVRDDAAFAQLVGGFVGLVEIVPVIGPLIGAILVVAVGLPQSVHVVALALLWLVIVREFQSYIVNPHLMGKSVGLSPLVTLVSVSVVGLLFGGFAVILAIPVTSAVATPIDVFVLDHEPPADAPQRQRRALPSRAQ
jgi:predicted PurR-regulated permease PerM